MLKAVLSFALTASCLLACATQSYSPRIDYIGQYRDAESANEAADAVTEREATNVAVLLNELPRGVSIVDGKITVAADSEWVLVAEATAHPNGGRQFWLMGFYDYNPDEAWRKGYCYWQVPLHWLTFGLWYMVPTDYVCNVSEGRSVGDVNDRKQRVVRTLQRAAKATNSDLVVLASERQTSVVRANTGTVISTLDWNGGSGFLFRRKR
jgi:hypothetical protein